MATGTIPGHVIPKLLDETDEAQVELDVLASKPICFLIVGKPGSGKSSLAARIAKTWKCVHIDAKSSLTDAVANGTELGVQCEELLNNGEKVSTALMVMVMMEKLASPIVQHHGYVLDDLPTIDEEWKSHDEQMEMIKSLPMPPDVIINLKIRDSELLKRRVGQKMDPLTGDVFIESVFTTKARHADSDDEDEEEERGKGAEKDGGTDGEGEDDNDGDGAEENEDEDPAAFVITTVDKEVAERLVRREEDEEPNVVYDLTEYSKSLLPQVEHLLARHDQMRLMELNASLPEVEVYKAMMSYLHVMNLPYAYAVTRLSETGDEDDIENLAEMEGEDPANVDADDMLRVLSASQVPGPGFRWKRSKWGRYCPVEMSHGKLALGRTELSVSFLSRIYCMSSVGAYIDFRNNPRRFLKAPMPRPPCKIAVMGGPKSGKSSLCQKLAEHFDATVIDMQDLIGPRLEELQKQKIEAQRKEFLQTALESVREAMRTENVAGGQDEDEFEARAVNVTEDHPEVQSQFEEMLAVAEQNVPEATGEVYAELLESQLQQLEEERKKESPDSPYGGRWILDGYPAQREQWLAMEEMSAPLSRPDVMVVLVDSSKNGETLQERWKELYPDEAKTLKEALAKEAKAEGGAATEAVEWPPRLRSLRARASTYDSNTSPLLALIKSSGIEPMELEITKPLDETVKQVIDTMEGEFKVYCTEMSQQDEQEDQEDSAAQAEVAQAIAGSGDGDGDDDGDDDDEDGGDVEPLEGRRNWGDTRHYCPVLLTRDNVLRPGSAEHCCQYHRKVYYLSNADDLELFLQDPDAYLPFKGLAKAPPMRVSLIGAKASGKSLHGRTLAREMGLLHIDFREYMQEFMVSKINTRYGRDVDDIPAEETDVKEIEQEALVEAEYQADRKAANEINDAIDDEDDDGPGVAAGRTGAEGATTEPQPPAEQLGQDAPPSAGESSERQRSAEQAKGDPASAALDSPPTDADHIAQSRPATGQDEELRSTNDRAPSPKRPLTEQELWSPIPPVERTAFNNYLFDDIGVERPSGSSASEESSEEITLDEMEESIRQFLEDGDSLPPETIERVVRPLWMEEPYRSHGFLLEGYPQTSDDVRAMADFGCLPDVVLFLNADEEHVTKRILPGRMKRWEEKLEHRLQRRAERHAKHRQEKIEDRANAKMRRENEVRAALIMQRDEMRADDDEYEETVDLEETVRNVVAQDFPEGDERYLEEEEGDEDDEAKEDADERMRTTIAENHEEAQGQIGGVLETLSDVMIQHVEIDANRRPHVVSYLIKQALEKWWDHRQSLLSRVIPIETATAQRMLRTGFKQASKFGRWCPVTLTEGSPILPPQNVGAAKGSFTVIHREHVYYLASLTARKKFIADPYRYLAVAPIPQPVALRIGVMGLPKSGRSTVAQMLCKTYGCMRLSIGEALRWCLANMKHTTLGEKLRGYLEIGMPVPDELSVQILEQVMMSPPVHIRGCVLDGFPSTMAQAKLLSKHQICPFLIVELQISADDSKGRARRMRVTYPTAEKDVRHDSSNILDAKMEVQSKELNDMRSYHQEKYRNWSLMDGTLGRWKVKTMCAEMADRSMRQVQDFTSRYRDGRAAPIAGLCVTQEEFESHRKTQYDRHCPVSWKDGELFDSSILPNMIDLSAEYQGHYYSMASPEHLKRFLNDPEPFVRNKPMPAPVDRPRIVPTEELQSLANLQLEYNGYCPVTFKHSGAKSVFPGPAGCERGDRQIVALYGGKYYCFVDEEHRQSFIKRPWKYTDLKMPRKMPAVKVPVNIAGLPHLGYFEQSLATTLSHAFAEVALAKPKYPFMSPQKSALMYIAYYLKVHNPNSSEFRKNHYRQKMKRFLEACRLTDELAKIMPNDHVPLTMRSVELRRGLQRFARLKRTKFEVR